MRQVGSEPFSARADERLCRLGDGCDEVLNRRCVLHLTQKRVSRGAVSFSLSERHRVRQACTACVDQVKARVARERRRSQARDHATVADWVENHVKVHCKRSTVP